jgi:hypothetical protein
VSRATCGSVLLLVFQLDVVCLCHGLSNCHDLCMPCYCFCCLQLRVQYD